MYGVDVCCDCLDYFFLVVDVYVFVDDYDEFCIYELL